jgi:hypothetical protein
MSKPVELGQAGLVGWREKVADGVAGPIASRSPLGAQQVRAAVGALFFALASYYVVTTAVRIARAARGS